MKKLTFKQAMRRLQGFVEVNIRSSDPGFVEFQKEYCRIAQQAIDAHEELVKRDRVQRHALNRIRRGD